MESRLVPHLYFAGELLDVDGITGGFNFPGGMDDRLDCGACDG
jgi:predicted flavoprotein YhiN